MRPNSKRRFARLGLKPEDFVALFQHMTTLLSSGVPLLETLTLVSHQTESKKLAGALLVSARDISAGMTLHGSMALHPSIYKTSYVSIIRIGEESGQLPQVLAQLSRHLTEAKHSHDKLKSALVYPFFLLLVSCVSLVVMLLKVIPSFAEFFSDFNASLPWLTQMVLDASLFARQWWPFAVGVPTVLALCLRLGLIPAPRWDKLLSWLRKIPQIGAAYDGISMEAFAQNLALFLRSGAPLYEALRMIQVGTPAGGIFSKSLSAIRLDISRGSSFAKALDKAAWFSPLIVSMARVGEESGKLAEVMDSIALHYRDKNRNTIQRLTQVLEPLIIVTMGLVIGAMLAAVYLPMFQLASLPGSH